MILDDSRLESSLYYWKTVIEDFCWSIKITVNILAFVEGMDKITLNMPFAIITWM